MFTETVAQVVFRSGRRDRLPSIEATVNHVIQQLHSKASWARDLTELRIEPTFAATDDQAMYVWPEPPFFRSMQAARVNGHCWLTYIRPSAGQGTHADYFYKTQDSYVFRASCGISWLDLSYYTKSPHLSVFAKGAEPASFDRGTETWSYLQVDETYGPNAPAVIGLTQEAANLAQQALVSNWMLNRWQEIIINGALAKLYADIRDDRQLNQYRLFQEGIADMKRNELYADESV